MGKNRENTTAAHAEPATPSLPVQDRDAVARRAYDLYLARGREEGHDVEDWLQAERELVAGPPPSGESQAEQ